MNNSIKHRNIIFFLMLFCSITLVESLLSASFAKISQPLSCSFINFQEPSFPSSTVSGSIVFSELMVAPKISASTLAAEYLEIYNRSSFSVPLNGWALYYDGRKYLFSSDTIASGAYLVLAHEKHRNQFPEGTPLLCFSSFPQLANSGKLIALYDATGKPIHWLEYSDKWYRNSDKVRSGYSIEAIDLDNLSGHEYNYIASKALLGGTPGYTNSARALLPDKLKLSVIKANWLEPYVLSLKFNKPLKVESLEDVSNFTFSPERYRLDELYLCYPRTDTLQLVLNRRVAVNDTLVIVLKLQDAVGNVAETILLRCASDRIIIGSENDGMDENKGEKETESVTDRACYVWLARDYLLPSSSGLDRMLQLYYSFPELGWKLRFSVFSRNGVLCYTSPDEECDADGVVTWNGAVEGGSSLSPGIYMLQVECMESTGEVKRFRCPFVVSIQ